MIISSHSRSLPITLIETTPFLFILMSGDFRPTICCFKRRLLPLWPMVIRRNSRTDRDHESVNLILPSRAVKTWVLRLREDLDNNSGTTSSNGSGDQKSANIHGHQQRLQQMRYFYDPLRSYHTYYSFSSCGTHILSMTEILLVRDG